MWGRKRKKETETIHVLGLSSMLKPEEPAHKAEPRMIDRFTVACAVDAMRVMDRGVASVEFRCSVPKENSYGLLQVVKTEFQRGDGHCGRHVIALHVDITADLLKITQVSVAEDVSESVRKFREGVERHQRDVKSIQRHGYGCVMAMNPTQRDFEHQLVALEKLAKEISEKAGKREIKEFTYKMSDVHGRIVTTR